MGASWVVSVGRLKQQRGSSSPSCVSLLCSAFLLFRPPAAPLQKTLSPLCIRAFPSALVTMVLLCKNSSSCSSWNYLQLGFAVQPWDRGLCPSLVQPFPVCVLGQVWRQRCLQGTAVPWCCGIPSRFLGTRIPLLCARLSHGGISCYS